MKHSNQSEEKPLVVIFLGLPGSGKGTQARLLKEEMALEYMGSGDLLRSRKKKDDFTGRKIARQIDNGKRVHTPVVFNIWMEKFEEFKQKKEFKGIIIDGSPRTVLEARMLKKALDWYEWLEHTQVLLIDISKEEAIQRLTKRRMCSQCGRIIPFVGKFKEIDKCDKCGGGLVTREDDDIEGVKARLGWFDTDVKPVIDYYQERGKLVKINGEQSIEDVFEDVLKALKK